MSPARAGVVALFALAAPTVLPAQSLTIDHKPVACIVAGRYPRLNACFAPTGEVVKPRVNFRMKTGPASYYTEMKSDMPCHVGFLPRPKKELIGQEIEIWLEGMDRAFNPARTAEYTVKVVGSEAECKDLPVAPWVSNAAVTVFPAMAPGFVAGAAIPTAALVGGATAVAVGAGTFVATRDNDNPTTTPTPNPTPGPTPAPTPTPGPTPTPTPPPGTASVDCTIRPRSGTAPLTVAFSAVATGFPGPVDFRWDFGDGTGSTDRETTHVYTAPGTFRAIVFATGGGQSATCDRNVVVSRPEDLRHTLDVSLIGTGTGTVTSVPGGISCAPDCSEVYPSGTVVSLTAAPAANSFFVGWSGACSGTGACTVTMTGDQSVTAKFDARALPATLTVVLGGSGFGGVTADAPPGGITCPSDCTETYPTVPTTVTLRAAPGRGSVFTNWSGAPGCSTSPACTLTLTADTTVTAHFDPAPVTLELHCLDGRASTTQLFPAGQVTVSPGALVCSSAPNGNVVTGTYTPGSNIVLSAVATPGTTFMDWSGACPLGTIFGTTSSCNLTVPSTDPVQVFVFFGSGSPLPSTATRAAPSADADGIALAWRHQLDVGGGAGQVLLNGATTVASGPGLNSVQGLGRRGENRLEGRVTRSGKAGTWRFELGSNLRLEPGSIRVLAGEVAVVTGDAIVFRLRGQAGEHVAFTFKLKR